MHGLRVCVWKGERIYIYIYIYVQLPMGLLISRERAQVAFPECL